MDSVAMDKIAEQAQVCEWALWRAEARCNWGNLARVAYFHGVAAGAAIVAFEAARAANQEGNANG